MVATFMYLIIAFFLYLALVKYKLSSAEGIVLLTILCFIKSCVQYLFTAGTIFNVFIIGSTQVHLADLILFLFLISCCNIIKSGIKRNYITLMILLTVVPLAFSIVNGLISGNFPSTAFFNDIRKFVLMFVAIYSSFRVFRCADDIELLNIKRMIHILMNFLLSYVILVWLLDLFFGVVHLPGQLNGLLSDGGSTFRIIHPMQAIVLALYTLWIFNDDLAIFNKVKIRTFFFMLITLLLQWRSVVAAFIIGFILVFIKCILLDKIKLSKILLFEIVLIIVFAIFSFSFSSDGRLISMLNNLFSSFESIKNNTGTFSTRTFVWKELLESLSVSELIFGQAFGSGYKSSVEWSVAAHNAYVDYIMITGIFGLVLFGMLILFAIFTLIKLREYLLSIELVSLLIFWFGYGFSLEHGVIIGFALAIIYRKQTETGVRRFEKTY